MERPEVEELARTLELWAVVCPQGLEPAGAAMLQAAAVLRRQARTISALAHQPPRLDTADSAVS